MQTWPLYGRVGEISTFIHVLSDCVLHIDNGFLILSFIIACVAFFIFFSLKKILHITN